MDENLPEEELLERLREREEEVLAQLARRQDAEDAASDIRYLRDAAEQGHDRAQYYLGYLYENGYAVGLDIPEAVAWYRRAAHARRGVRDVLFAPTGKACCS